MNTIEFSKIIADKFDDMGLIYKKNLDDYDEILPHIFMSMMAENVVSEYKKNGIRNIKDKLEFLEHSFRDGGDCIKNLISVSFLENLPYPDEEGFSIARELGGAMHREFEKIRSWKSTI